MISSADINERITGRAPRCAGRADKAGAALRELLGPHSWPGSPRHSPPPVLFISGVREPHPASCRLPALRLTFAEVAEWRRRHMVIVRVWGRAGGMGIFRTLGQDERGLWENRRVCRHHPAALGIHTRSSNEAERGQTRGLQLSILPCPLGLTAILLSVCLSVYGACLSNPPLSFLPSTGSRVGGWGFRVSVWTQPGALPVHKLSMCLSPQTQLCCHATHKLSSPNSNFW